MKLKLTVIVALVAMAYSIPSSLLAQGDKRIKLTELEQKKIGSTGAPGYVAVTDANGNMRYQQMVNVNPTPIAFTPATTGNPATYYNQFVQQSPADTVWYIDWTGRATPVGIVSVTQDRDWLRVSDDAIPDNINNYIYTQKGASINARLSREEYEFIVNDSTTAGKGAMVVQGNRDAVITLQRNEDGLYTEVQQRGSTAVINSKEGVGRLIIGQSTGNPPGAAVTESHVTFDFDNNTTIHHDYPNTRVDASPVVNYLYTDANGVQQSRPALDLDKCSRVVTGTSLTVGDRVIEAGGVWVPLTTSETALHTAVVVETLGGGLYRIATCGTWPNVGNGTVTIAYAQTGSAQSTTTPATACAHIVGSNHGTFFTVQREVRGCTSATNVVTSAPLTGNGTAGSPIALPLNTLDSNFIKPRGISFSDFSLSARDSIMMRAIQPTDFYDIALIGQSNHIGQQGGSTIPRIMAPNLVVWNGSAWVKPVLGQLPFNLNGSDNIGLRYAERYALEHPKSIVRLVLDGNNGQPISYWLSSPNTGLINAANTINAAGITKLDVMLWMQGESDYNRSSAAYEADFNALMVQWRSNPWWTPTTKHISIGLYTGAGNLYGFQNETLERIGGDADVFTCHATTKGQQAYDNIHYTNESLYEIGYESVYDAHCNCPYVYKPDPVITTLTAGAGIDIAANQIQLGRPAGSAVEAAVGVRLFDGMTMGLQDGGFTLNNLTAGFATTSITGAGNIQRSTTNDKTTFQFVARNAADEVTFATYGNGVTETEKAYVISKDRAIIYSYKQPTPRPIGVSVGNIVLPNISAFWVGSINVTVVSGGLNTAISGQSGNGQKLEKKFNASLNLGGALNAGQSSRVLEVDPQIANLFSIGELAWNGSNWVIPITANNAFVSDHFAIELEIRGGFQQSSTGSGQIGLKFAHDIIIPAGADFVAGGSFTPNRTRLPNGIPTFIAADLNAAQAAALAATPPLAIGDEFWFQSTTPGTPDVLARVK